MVKKMQKLPLLCVDCIFEFLRLRHGTNKRNCPQLVLQKANSINQAHRWCIGRLAEENASTILVIGPSPTFLFGFIV